MNTDKIGLTLCGIFLPLFLLLFSYQLTLALYPLTPAQENTLQFLQGGTVTLNYIVAEISHLEDVAEVMKGVHFLSYASGIIILFLVLHSWKDKIQLQKLIRYGGMATIIVIALILLLILFNFHSFFTIFHQIFFPQGNWQFAADSLLIQTFPIEFFVKISIAIFALTLLLGSLFILLSVYLKHGHTNKGN